MPQMSPLIWLILFLYFLFCFFVVFNEIFFFSVHIKLGCVKVKKFFKKYFKWEW